MAEHAPLCICIYRGGEPHEGPQFQMTLLFAKCHSMKQMYTCVAMWFTSTPGTIKETNPQVNKAQTLPPKLDFLIPTASTPPGSWVTHTSLNAHQGVHLRP